MVFSAKKKTALVDRSWMCVCRCARGAAVRVTTHLWTWSLAEAKRR